MLPDLLGKPGSGSGTVVVLWRRLSEEQGGGGGRDQRAGGRGMGGAASQALPGLHVRSSDGTSLEVWGRRAT